MNFFLLNASASNCSDYCEGVCVNLENGSTYEQDAARGISAIINYECVTQSKYDFCSSYKPLLASLSMIFRYSPITARPLSKN